MSGRDSRNDVKSDVAWLTGLGEPLPVSDDAPREAELETDEDAMSGELADGGGDPLGEPDGLLVRREVDVLVFAGGSGRVLEESWKEDVGGPPPQPVVWKLQESEGLGFRIETSYLIRNRDREPHDPFLVDANGMRVQRILADLVHLERLRFGIK